MKNNITSLKSVIENEINQNDRLKEGIINYHWEEIVGKIHSKTILMSINDGAMKIGANDSVILHALSLNKDKILKQSNVFLKKDIIKEITFVIYKNN